MYRMHRFQKAVCVSIIWILLFVAVSCGPKASEDTPQATAVPAETPDAGTVAEATPEPEQPSETPEATPEPTPEATSEPTPDPTPVPPTTEEWIERARGQSVICLERNPTSSIGEDGDFCYNTSNTAFFFRQDGKWRFCFNLRHEGWHLIRYQLDGDELLPEYVRDGEPPVDLPVSTGSGTSFSGWYDASTGAPWDFSQPAPDRSLVLCGYTLNERERVSPLLTWEPIMDSAFHPSGTNGLLVVFVKFTDGYAYDEAKLRDMFEGDYPQSECLRSVASYFKYASYGNVNFDVQYLCWDTGMTSKEGYDLVQKKYDKFLVEIFDQIRKTHPELTQAADKDGNGYVEMVAFLSGEDPKKTVGDGDEYYLYGGSMGSRNVKPDPKKPTMNRYISMSYDSIQTPIESGDGSSGPRILYHELGHGFGLHDYYDFYPYNDVLVNTIGGFDMQVDDMADWNAFSRFSCGWTTPYVITPDVDRITLKIGASGDCPDAVLIPTSEGWNGTPFDEYLLLDVLAPVGASGFDWPFITADYKSETKSGTGYDGGVRIMHVDARLREARYNSKGTRDYFLAYTYDDIMRALESPNYYASSELWTLNYNTNGLEPELPDASRFWHVLDLIPRDGSDRFWLNHQTSWSIYSFLHCNDLYVAGDTFSMERCSDAFPEGMRMNNGGTMDYEVHVDLYDPVNHEAIVTITRTAP